MREYPQKIWPNIWYLYVTSICWILDFPSSTRPSRSSSATRRAMFLESSKPQWGLASNGECQYQSLRINIAILMILIQTRVNITSMIRTIMTTIKTITMILQTMRLLPKKDVSLDPRGRRHSHPQSDRCSPLTLHPLVHLQSAFAYWGNYVYIYIYMYVIIFYLSGFICASDWVGVSQKGVLQKPYFSDQTIANFGWFLGLLFWESHFWGCRLDLGPNGTQWDRTSLETANLGSSASPGGTKWC